MRYSSDLALSVMPGTGNHFFKRTVTDAGVPMYLRLIVPRKKTPQKGLAAISLQTYVTQTPKRWF